MTVAVKRSAEGQRAGGADGRPLAGQSDVGGQLEVLAGKKRELPIYSVERSDKKIALTVDAAWEADKTDFILDTLDKYNIHATFFLCGFWADKYPEKVKAIAARGNEVGNHSSTHPHMNQLSAADIRKELEKYDDTIEKLLGYRTKAFRCPYGEYNDNVITTVRDMGYEVWQWDIDTIDWKEERSAQTILDTVIPKLHPGCVILCHNNGYKIKEYLPTLQCSPDIVRGALLYVILSGAAPA